MTEPRHDKTNKMSVRPAKTQIISLGIRPVWSESSMRAQWVAKNPSFLHANSEDSDQPGWMPRLIWVYAGRTLTLLVLSCRGSCFLSFRIIQQFFRCPHFLDFYSICLTVQYRKTPKISDTWKFAVITLKVEQDGFTLRVIHPKDAEGIANSVDPDQTALLGALWSGYALFAQACLSKNLGSLW